MTSGAQHDVVRDWFLEEFPDLEVSAPRIDGTHDVVMFKAGDDRRGSLY